jgi:phosphoserine phosphatase RsbU/P
MEAVERVAFREQLLERREKLDQVVQTAPEDDRLARLLREVDDALARIEAGTYGICEVCRDPVEVDRLRADPLLRFCLDHLPPAEQRALEDELRLAARIQGRLLPARDVQLPGWQVHLQYRPKGLVSGDYADVVPDENGGAGAVFVVGDVTGKGVAASLLMAHLHAIFRSLAIEPASPGELLARANRIFCDSVLPSTYATLVCGRLGPRGEVRMSNAGHCVPVRVGSSAVEAVPATGLPLGLFCTGAYEERTVSLEPGESLVLYTDGLTESRNPEGREYGTVRMLDLLGGLRAGSAAALASALLADLDSHRGGRPFDDDLTLMVVRRMGE